MSQWQHIQREFSGGEISSSMLMRADTEAYKKSVLEMVNFMPTPQGSARRMPGTRFYQELDSLNARIIPYLTSGNERSILILTPEGLQLVRNVTDRIGDDDEQVNIEVSGSSILFRKNIVDNHSYRRGQEGWILNPEKYTGVNGEGPLGVYVQNINGGSRLVLRPRLYRYSAQEFAQVTATATAEVDTATSVVTIDYNAVFANQPAVVADGGYTLRITVSENSDFSDPIFEKTYNEVTHPNAGTTFEVQENADLSSAGFTGTLYIKFFAEATATDAQPYSNPMLAMRFFRIFANGEATLTSANLATPYVADDLNALHYIQSPYDDKELVITHPKHEPRKLFFNTGAAAYQFPAISFTNAPSAWAVNNYPATCTSFLGRLVLAGGQSFKTATADPVATVAETVWMTEVGNWDVFTTAPSDPDDSIEFTAVYRSPIQWVYGQKSLLVGSLEFEYSARGEGILQPGDLGVFLQSTHGSNNVQPAAFGEAVLFPSDGGTKVRTMAYRDETQGWIADDLTVLNPEICYPRIRRMARLRNPHQMCVVLKEDGTLAVFHTESGLAGWSRYQLDGGFIRDICVVPDNDGLDVLFLTVQRDIEGVPKLFLEFIPQWRETFRWDYTQATKRFYFETPTATITGLDYLEGKIVQVTSSGRYLGFYIVSDGSITLSNDGGETEIPVVQCTVGLGHRAHIKTLPPEKMDPGAKARFVDYSLRIRASTRPIVNGERPRDRAPQTILNVSQPLDDLNDVSILKFGHDAYQQIEISEHIPFACEILGLYGLVKQGTT